MTRYDDYTTGYLLDYLYHQNYYKAVGIDILKQTNTSIPQEINFTGKLQQDDGDATIFFITEKQQETFLNFSLDSLFVTK